MKYDARSSEYNSVIVLGFFPSLYRNLYQLRTLLFL